VVSPTDYVLIVTGGSTGPGGEIARTAANRGYAVVVVYLENQRGAEATVDQIVGTNGTAVAVRADLSDELDVERLFQETVAMFGGVDVIVHTDSRGGGLIDRQAARQLRCGGAIVNVGTSDGVKPLSADELRALAITVVELTPDLQSAESAADSTQQAAIFDRWLVTRGSQGV
jgi:3-oxoacyl-[acyl-carrier protein] reductase